MRLSLETRYFALCVITRTHYDVAADRVLTPRVMLAGGDFRLQPLWAISWVSDRAPFFRAHSPRHTPGWLEPA